MSGRIDRKFTAPWLREVSTETHYPRPFEIGVALGGALFCAVGIVVLLFADSGLTRFAALARQIW